MKTPLPVSEQAQKNDLIEHVNDDHQDEMGYVLQAFAGIDSTASLALSDVFQEGVDFAFTTTQYPSPQTVFVAFTSKGDTHNKVRFLVMDAMLKLGKGKNLRLKRYFRVQNITHHTDNMLRLTLHSPMLLPPPQAAYACSVALHKQTHFPTENALLTAIKKKLTPPLERSWLWLMKRLPQRFSEHLAPPKTPIRTYTYRHIDSDAQCIWLDVFLHGDTPANRWTHSLNVGDVIHTIGERGEKLQYLQQGKALLCADETALPALAGILQHWQNPEPPVVAIEVGNQSEHQYLCDVTLPENTTFVWLDRGQDAHGEAIMDYLQQHVTRIDCAWGALEYHGAKTVRHYVRQQYDLTAKAAKVAAYWRQEIV